MIQYIQMKDLKKSLRDCIGCPNKNNGFTLVELMLAMGFASVLLIAIAMTVIQISNIYNRGITLKEVNEAGRTIVSELQKNVNGNESFRLNSCSFSVNVAPSCNFVDTTSTGLWGGRLCIGSYSYIWNNGNTINSTTPAYINKYTSASSVKIRFVKVLDPSADYCVHSSKNIILADAVELLNSSQHDLAIHGFTISSLISDSRTGQSINNISFLIGTNVPLTINYTPGSDPRCKLPNEAGADQAYCSINKFNILTRAGSVSG